ncbi:hypothetical protein GWR56_11200 [Mucilaginibacter sp. 14171R-50]|uniref:hypothetical protein n=1 Tax=Mucilaginibacter sp. 14171R-50 TaxID=2703789 RepID=UPI00138D4870|nr:hypothetical protein [Mucilaginibacter sp. 14171R-50]QHS56072.1 hypothetical protein GWR56_11200 [Mucilaginibacter sp. 14171R-50]
MRKLIFKEFSGWSKEEKLANFVNENNIQQKDILNVIYRTLAGDIVIFYYIE